MLTAIPATFPSVISHSPVWMPARMGTSISRMSGADRPGAADCAGRPVEASEEPVAGSVDLPATEAGESRPDAPMVLGHELCPGAIAQGRQLSPSTPRCR